MFKGFNVAKLESKNLLAPLKSHQQSHPNLLSPWMDRMYSGLPSRTREDNQEKASTGASSGIRQL